MLLMKTAYRVSKVNLIEVLQFNNIIGVKSEFLTKFSNFGNFIKRDPVEPHNSKISVNWLMNMQ